ncbi:hypothetical protein WSS15_01130 [Acetobacter pasteurianus]|nr:hypothetical protein WSS15_01130 [Acetobacter pasteurianus]
MINLIEKIDIMLSGRTHPSVKICGGTYDVHDNVANSNKRMRPI